MQNTNIKLPQTECIWFTYGVFPKCFNNPNLPYKPNAVQNIKIYAIYPKRLFV